MRREPYEFGVTPHPFLIGCYETDGTTNEQQAYGTGFYYPGVMVGDPTETFQRCEPQYIEEQHGGRMLTLDSLTRLVVFATRTGGSGDPYPGQVVLKRAGIATTEVAFDIGFATPASVAAPFVFDGALPGDFGRGDQHAGVAMDDPLRIKILVTPNGGVQTVSWGVFLVPGHTARSGSNKGMQLSHPKYGSVR